MRIDSRQDEFIYIPEGEPTLVTEDGEAQLRPGIWSTVRTQIVLYPEIGEERASARVSKDEGEGTAEDSYPHPENRAP